MAVNLAASDVGTALVLDTETQLLTITAPAAGATYAGSVDLNNLVAGEVVTITVRTKCLASGATSVAFVDSFAGSGSVKIALCPAIACESGVEYEVLAEQSGGTGRAFPAKIVRIGS